MAKMLQTKRSIDATLTRYFGVQESNDDAVVIGLQGELDGVDAKRAATLADDYAESQAIRAQIESERELAAMEVYAASGLPYPGQA